MVAFLCKAVLAISAWWVVAAGPLVEHVPLMPLPKEHSHGSAAVVIAGPSQLKLTVLATGSKAAEEKVIAAFERFVAQTFAGGDDDGDGGSDVALAKVNIVVDHGDPDLQMGVDESYSLEVPVSGEIRLQAATVYGAYHGLSTLSQLASFDYDSLSYKISMAPWSIQDSPRYPHRELLVDTSRHFLPVVALEHIIDSMTMAKVNVLHWHIIDIQSFPAASRVHPELAQKGAYGPTERYTWAQMRHIVEFAQARGIRVVPEFDVPAHTDSWHKSHPELFPDECTQALDPAKEEVYTFYEELLKDWSDIFTDHVVHLGTDELPTSCWNNSVDIDFMRQQGLSSLNDLFGYFVKRVVTIAEGLGKRACVWDESVLRTNLTPSAAMVQIWHTNPGLRQLSLSAGHDVIFSPDGPWYLDGLATTWEQMYEEEPELNGSSGPGRILGGGGEMWGETVDPSDLESTVWPRMAAIAERLWSPLEETSVGADAARLRMQAFRCWLLHRGVRSGLVGGSGRAPPPGPGACDQAGKAETETTAKTFVV
mmetsp:Transcript_41159/g.96633  ORF Transcript_41159/g.96633 Transcript_41159/m.96633 type:complete len:537 (+) Transcript_41159:65-1675(+)